MKWFNKGFAKLDKIQERINTIDQAGSRRRKGRQPPRYNTWGMLQELRLQLSMMGYYIRPNGCCVSYYDRKGPVAATARRMMVQTGGRFY